SPRKASDQSARIVWTWESDAFGSTPPNEDPSSTGTKTTINLRLPGQYFDAESGLYYNGNRYYDPRVGRYTQSDPIGLGGGVNTYAYVGGNPVNSIDPFGLECTTASGFTTCNFPGGPSFKIPAQPGFPDVLVGWNPLAHAYDVVQGLGEADLQCVLDKIKNNPTPGNPNPATPNGTPNNAVVPGVAPVNIVTSYLTTDLRTGSQVVVNVTGPRSAFGPGYVARYVSNGIAHTVGEGTHPIQSFLVPSMVRTAANELLWGKQMKKFVDECICKK
ncbi:MAG: RHS repeat-associated core domain-containing protein, partial [Burkholderiales bacterium]